MIKPVTRAGAARVEITCDSCGRVEVIACEYVREHGPTPTPNKVHAIAKITARGWTHIKNKLRCPTCEAARKAGSTKPPEEPMSAPAPRIMSDDMRLDIMEALFASYDRKAKRYTGHETDRTVAEAVGNDCMQGWVATVRESNFGPAGNEEAEIIRSEITALKAHMDSSIHALTTRIDALYAAEDKRVRRK